MCTHKMRKAKPHTSWMLKIHSSVSCAFLLCQARTPLLRSGYLVLFCEISLHGKNGCERYLRGPNEETKILIMLLHKTTNEMEP